MNYYAVVKEYFISSRRETPEILSYVPITKDTVGILNCVNYYEEAVKATPSAVTQLQNRRSG